MRRLIYLFIFSSFILSSCSDDTSETTEFENIGTVTGIWAFESFSASVETSNSSYSLILNPLLAIALESYAGSQEPTYYVFEDDLTFSAYLTEVSEDYLFGYGTYKLGETELELTYTSSSQTETFEIVVVNENSLVIKKDYSNSTAIWGLSILEGYTDVTITKAESTLSYVKRTL